jgi:D-alanine--D-alanine ligase
MKRTRLAVLFGGQSSEYEVSLVSAYSILNNIDRDKYEIITIGITKEGRWLLYNGSTDRIKSDHWNQPGFVKDAFISPSPFTNGIIALIGDSEYTTIKIDVVFPVLHGKNGEDGTIQGLLEMSGLPYVGCDTLTSAICMDKCVSHEVLHGAGIKTADWLSLSRTQTCDLELCQKLVGEKFEYPVFVKPANAGSSVGISKVKKPEELGEAILKAAKTDRKMIVEQVITGREVECAVLGNDEPVASDIGEIVPSTEFYDYDSKYNNDSAGLYVPARVDEGLRRRVSEIALKAYKIVGCTGLARVDFFLQPDNTIILNELNTLPGFTPISMYPKLFEYFGKSYIVLLDDLINLALKRREAKN